MILKRLRLKGIRSWEKGEIVFKEGFTTIVGSKGAGKSSIIAAVEFSLFGDEAFRDYGGLMREGVRSSDVLLEVEEQGKCLAITRGLSRVGEAVSQSSGRLKLEVDGAVHTLNKAGDLNRDVGELLRVDCELLEHTCLSKQEELKHLLNTDARSRKRIVDGLLGFDSFETAWGELGEVIRDKEGYVRRLREDAAKYDLEALSKSYEDSLMRTEELKKSSRGAEERCRLEEEKLELVTLELKAFDQDAKEYYREKKEIDEKRRQLADGVAKAEGLKGRIESLKQSLDDAESEEEQLECQAEELWTSLVKVGYAGKRELASLKESAESLSEAVVDMLNALSVDEKTIEDEQSREQALSGGEVCPYCGQPLASHRAEKFRQERLKHIENLQGRVGKNRAGLESSRQLSKMYASYCDDLGKLLYRVERLENQTRSIRTQMKDLQKELDAVQTVNSVVASRIETAEYSLPAYDEALHTEKREAWMKQTAKTNETKNELQQLQTSLQSLATSLTDLSDKLQEGREVRGKAEKYEKVVEELQRVRGGCRAVLPTLRNLYLKSVERNIQKTYRDLNPSASFAIKVDEDYTPAISVGTHTRSYRDLSGGERTEIALAYRIGLGNAIYEARTGAPMELLILDEPTESLGNEEEDRAIERLAAMLSNLKTRQIIVITHDPTFAQFADNTIQIRNLGNSSTSNEIDG